MYQYYSMLSFSMFWEDFFENFICEYCIYITHTLHSPFSNFSHSSPRLMISLVIVIDTYIHTYIYSIYNQIYILPTLWILALFIRVRVHRWPLEIRQHVWKFIFELITTPTFFFLLRIAFFYPLAFWFHMEFFFLFLWRML